MNEYDWNDCNWKKQIVDEVLYLDIGLNEVKDTIEQGDSKIRAPEKYLLKIVGDAIINPTQPGPERKPAGVETRPNTIP